MFMSDEGKLPVSLGIEDCNSETLISRYRYFCYSSFGIAVSKTLVCRMLSFNRQCEFQVALHPFHRVCCSERRTQTRTVSLGPSYLLVQFQCLPRL